MELQVDRSLRRNTPVFSRFTSRERKTLLDAIFSLSYAFLSFKGTAPKVLWKKDISRRSKELKSDPRSCTWVWAPC